MLHEFDFDTFQNGYATALRNLKTLDTINILLSVCIQYFDKNLYENHFTDNAQLDDFLNIRLTAGQALPAGAKPLFRRFATAHASDKVASMVQNLNLNNEESDLLSTQAQNIGSFINSLINGDTVDPGIMEAATVATFNIFRNCFITLKNTPADQRNKFLQRAAAGAGAKPAATAGAKPAAAAGAKPAAAAGAKPAAAAGVNFANTEALLQKLRDALQSGDKKEKENVLFNDKKTFKDLSKFYRDSSTAEKQNIDTDPKFAGLSKVINAFDKIESAKEGNTVTVDSVEEAREIAEQGGIGKIAKALSPNDGAAGRYIAQAAPQEFLKHCGW